MEGKLRHHPSVAELEAGLAGWAQRWPDRISVETRGRSAEGRPILLARVTDASAPDTDKAVVLLSVSHCDELSGIVGLLHLTRWLLSNDPTADRIRRGIVTLVMPCLNPDGYDRMRDPTQSRAMSHDTTKGTNPYTSWTWDGPVDPENNPEAQAVFQVAEEYQPDAAMDVHGAWLDEYGGYETTGFSWYGFASRAHSAAIVEELDRAVEEQDFVVIYPEEDSGRVKVNAPVEGLSHHFYHPGEVLPTLVSYLYNRYHTLALMCEAVYSESTFARCRRLLELGLNTWRHEFVPGYPVNQIGNWTCMTVSAWGDTAAKRRRSRVELWQKAAQLCYGTIRPEPAYGKRMAVCTTSIAAGQRWLGDGKMETVLRNLARHPHINHEYIARFVSGTLMSEFPNLHNASENQVRGNDSASAMDEPIANGLALRMYIPTKAAKVVEARIDGHVVSASPVDGYQMRQNPGTIIQFNIPPEKVGDIHIVTCEYETATRRRFGFISADWQ